MGIQKTPGIVWTRSGTTQGFKDFAGNAENPVNPTSKTGSANTSSEPKYTLLSTEKNDGYFSISSETIQRIGYAAFRVFLVLGAIGLMAVGHGIAIALGVLLFLAAVCTLPSAKDRDN
jgi:hypothetical protein